MLDSQLIPIAELPYGPIIQMVIDGLDSPHSRRQYGRALRDFLLWYRDTRQSELSRRVVARYVAYMRDEVEMSPSNINLRLVAIRRLAHEASLNQVLDEHLAMGIEMLKGVRQEGQKVGNWLTKAQAQELLLAPDPTTPKGIRDRAMLATLLGTGLRREEVTNLTFSHLQQREGRWAVVDLVGKRNKTRTIPMPPWAKAAIDKWSHVSGLSVGFVFRPLSRGGNLTRPHLDARAVHSIVAPYADALGFGVIAPHDLRRTFAKLAYRGGAQLDQISMSLGHESIETTQKYLGIEQSFTDAPCDHLGLSLG